MEILEKAQSISEKEFVSDLKVGAYKIPAEEEESDGTITWDSTTLVLVTLTGGGKTGMGYTYADAATAFFIDKTLKKEVIGNNLMDIPAITNHLIQRIRNNGQTGIAMMAVSAIDNALWDLKAKVLNLPLYSLLGQVKETMLIYGSGGFTSYTDKKLQQQLSAWVECGTNYVKMKIGREPAKDAERVKKARESIGSKAKLFVDANGAYTVKQAIEKAKEFEPYDIYWLEEPVRADNNDGLRFIRQHAAGNVNIAAGEYGYNLQYFQKMLTANAVDILQADATRCGGMTGFLKAGHLSEAYQLPFSSHCAPALHLHAALALPSFFIAEYFYDHVRIEQMLFEGVPLPENGMLKPDFNRPGFGFDFKYTDAEKFQI